MDEQVKPDEETKESARKRNHNRILGKRGEDAAARYLTERGYEILARNWVCPFGEADIIARTEGVLVLIEVKTRMDENRGMPEEAVTKEKRERYERIAICYAREFEDVGIQIRFDVIGIVVVAPDRAVIRHHINAFGSAR